MYACDQAWWKLHLEAVKASFKGVLYTQYRNEGERQYALDNGIKPLQGEDEPGLGRNVLRYNENSGAQAINLAYLMGAKRIILLGYDMQNTGGKSHFFGDHPLELSTGNYAVYVERFTLLAEHLRAERVEVINCSRQTALYQFPRADLESVLCQL